MTLLVRKIYGSMNSLWDSSGSQTREYSRSQSKTTISISNTAHFPPLKRHKLSSHRLALKCLKALKTTLRVQTVFNNFSLTNLWTQTMPLIGYQNQTTYQVASSTLPRSVKTNTPSNSNGQIANGTVAKVTNLVNVTNLPVGATKIILLSINENQ